MAEKKNFMLRIESDVYKALEKWSADEFRSVNGQIEYLLNKALKEARRLDHTKMNSTSKKSTE
ncbi:Arc family DNA binding domain-containing protein [Sphingobacterium sp. SRCM116780]|uniref:Arc family DNA binding domain-containing protein n=1 Tax=Sphingobacterium sp. SRCM116780 TaxID=2907623 RepID=UPI001F192ED1|nr:Arc family DNA binding domain-containing protein [Sphingobacterium sp. SRCM116780]UIR57209.1 Arc family DNA binding domain-containing protein [Sphingobacterium sp. SRCM116780]